MHMCSGGELHLHWTVNCQVQSGEFHRPGWHEGLPARQALLSGVAVRRGTSERFAQSHASRAAFRRSDWDAGKLRRVHPQMPPWTRV